MQKHLEKRKDGKTAFVVSVDIDFGLGRQYEAYANKEQLPVSYRVFKTVSQAKDWLFSNE